MILNQSLNQKSNELLSNTYGKKHAEQGENTNGEEIIEVLFENNCMNDFFGMKTMLFGIYWPAKFSHKKINQLLRDIKQ